MKIFDLTVNSDSTTPFISLFRFSEPKFSFTEENPNDPIYSGYMTFRRVDQSNDNLGDISINFDLEVTEEFYRFQEDQSISEEEGLRVTRKILQTAVDYAIEQIGTAWELVEIQVNEEELQCSASSDPLYHGFNYISKES
jgi:hypothetical protein